MAKNDVEGYLDELSAFADDAKGMDLYSLKKELLNLSESSHVFDNFEKESMSIGREELSQMQNLSSLIKLRNLAREIKNKKEINGKLHSLHFSLNLLKNTDDTKALKNSLDLFLYNSDTKIGNIISELNDFKHKINEVKKHHENLLPKSLDNKLKIEGKYDKHIEKLHSMHKRQKTALVSLVRLFLKQAKQHIKTLQKFKKQGEKQ